MKISTCTSVGQGDPNSISSFHQCPSSLGFNWKDEKLLLASGKKKSKRAKGGKSSHGCAGVRGRRKTWKKM